MIRLVDFGEYQDDIVGMMMDMQDLEMQSLDVPRHTYLELQEMGILLPFLWFGDDSAIKGVALLFKSPSLRNETIIDVSTDVLWVKPEHRFGAHVFINAIKQQLKDMGVNYWMVSSRNVEPIDEFLMVLEFKPLEKVFYHKL